MNPLRFAFLLLYALSGMVTLAVEIIWIRLLGIHVGGTVAAATLVFCSFFLFAALGNLLAAVLIPRISQPLRSYGLAECGYGALALLSLPLLAYFGPWLGGGQSFWQWTLLATLCIGPASLIQGLCFPLLSHAFIRSSQQRCAQAGTFYGVNLLGAASGCFLGGILLPSRLGFHTSLIVFCAISLLLGITALLISRRLPCPPASAHIPKQHSPHLPLLPVIALTASGVLSIAFEVLVFAWFRQITTSSLQATMAVLLAFILGLGAGSLIAALLRKHRHPIKNLPVWCLIASGLILTCYPAGFRYFLIHPLVDPAASLWGRSLELAVKSTLILLPACLSIGTLFPLFWDLLPKQEEGRAIGMATFFNKLGCALGAWGACFLLMPQFGLFWSVFLCGLGYLLLAFALDTTRNLKLYAVVVGGWLLIGLTTPTQPQAESGQSLLTTIFGFGNVVKVTESETSRFITLNESYVLNGTAAALPWQQQESWIPLFFTPSPQRVCFIGMASGIGANAALDLPIQQLDSIELVPQVKEAAARYFSTWNQRLFSNPRASVHVDDGRHFLTSSHPHFDTIICSLFLPSREGSSHLYSRDFFRTALDSLTTNGRFCLWLPLYQMDAEIADCILATFQQSFPHAIMVRGNLSPRQPVVGLMGSRSPFDLSQGFLLRRLEELSHAGIATKSPFFRDLAHARLLLMGDLKSEAYFASGHPINSDNHPYIAFHGDKPIPSGKHLRGITLLNHFGKHFQSENFPSCTLGSVPTADLQRSIRAGYQAYAASVFHFPIPGNQQTQDRRAKQTRRHLGTAQSLLPGLQLRVEDLQY